MITTIHEFLMTELNKSYLIDYRDSLLKYIDDEKFQNQLQIQIEDRNLSVFSLFQIFYEFFYEYDNISPKAWIINIFNWVLDKSFPSGKKPSELEPLFNLFINILNFFISNLGFFQNEFINKYPLSLLSDEEESYKDVTPEYNIFKDVFSNHHIRELMYLDMSISGHNTLEHVIGVNHLSMYIGRQLYSLGLPVDLGIVAGASLGHDIGKYGVLPDEKHRVPYLHYYYTEEWFKRFNMNKIGHIATNHSTWDLELETLPLESLILIYSDFRVKNRVENNIYNMHIYSLEDAFEVILKKLDNVDEKKENRYKKVYKRLKDFEEYIISLGVDTTLKSSLVDVERKPFELMNKKEVIDNIKYIAIENNLNLMAKLTSTASFNNIIEKARGESDWRKLRLYLQVFREYSIYLTQEQKTTTIHFLSDLLLHTGEDIRKEAAEIIGKLIAVFDEEYRKEIPQSVSLSNHLKGSEELLDDFLQSLLFPDHKIADSQKEWLYNLKNTIKSLFRESHISNHKKYFDVLRKYYDTYIDLSPVAQFYLSQTIDYIPISSLDEDRLLKLFTYTLEQLDSNDLEIRLTTLDSISQMLAHTNNIMFIASIRNWIIANMDNYSTLNESYLKSVIGRKINISPNYQLILDKNYNENKTSEIFLQNLKTATEWVIKKVNIDILYDQVIKNPSKKGLHTSMHLCNLLKVSAVERVRNYSGITLLNIISFLSLEERNDVAIELLRALELESYQFSKFIPRYLGQILLSIPPKEFDEIIDDFEEKLKTSSAKTIYLILNTIAVTIENYFVYKSRFEEENIFNSNRMDKLLGLFSIAMASYDNDIKNESLRVLSSTLFSSKTLGLDEKQDIFCRIGKKIITLLEINTEDDFLFFNNAASLNHIYKFLSDYEFFHDSLTPIDNQDIAFFPGSFDPFSLGHKEIAVEIRNKGFQVYLAVDEFSWSKRTEPHVFRRNIINMSIANEKDIQLFPENIPINIGNPKDLDTLKNLFPNKKIYIVVGSDVLINASAYKKDGVILDFPHIVFDRKSNISQDSDEIELEKNIKNIKSHVLRLTLPPQYEDISSTQIRQNIDLNRTISKFIDPLAESYIYEHGLYLREPQYKTLIQSKTIHVEVIKDLNEYNINEIMDSFRDLVNVEHFHHLREKLNYRILLLRDSVDNRLLGFSSFYWIRQNTLYDEFKDPNITDYIRRNAKGRTILISGICVENNDEKLIEIVLNETLSTVITRDYNFSIYNNLLTYENIPAIEEQLLSQGFVNTGHVHMDSPLFIVDMNNPITLNLDLENMLKPPYSSNKFILETINDTRKKLKAALSNLYPGELLLTYNKDMIYSKLIQKICDANDTSIISSKDKIYGNNMCVPFGSILNGSIIPNTVTKTMHTEKIFESNIIDFTIGEYPNYLSLQNQAKMLKSFNRPIILVDDLLHKGYRINVIEPILREANIEMKKVVVGILSSRGKEIGDIKGLDLDYAYFVPNLKLWFNESSQYPFIGGDMVRNHDAESLSIPSINMILPYVSPGFIKNTKNNTIYELSEICLDNSYKIFRTIEDIYQQINEKGLNIRTLGEVIISPKHPDTNKSLNKNAPPSSLIENDLQYLRRLENIIKR